MNIPEILQWVKFGQKTGCLAAERKGIVKKVFVDKGLIVSSSSNDPKEYLGQIFVFFGWLTEEKLNEAFKLQGETNKLLGRILTESYGLKDNQILHALKVKIEETIYDLFLWEEGKFIFSEGIDEMREHDRLDTAITIDQVMFEGARRLDEWKEFRKEFPNEDVVFKARPGVTELGDLEKDFVAKKIFKSIDGIKNLRGVLLDTHAPEYRGVEALAKLYWGKYIEPAKKAISRPKQTDMKKIILQEAVESFKSGKFELSYDMVEQYLLREPNDAEATTLFQMARDALLKSLRVACPSGAVPRLTIDFSQLSEKVFSSKEGYLASRVNGQWDVKSLVMVSPLGEMESLRILKKLSDEGLIKFSKGT